MADQKEIERRAKEYISRETDDTFRHEVEQLMHGGNTAELTDRFYTTLEFGTGGLRGIVGGGYNRMNTLVVRQATEGLARYVRAHVQSERGGSATPKAVISYDSRHYSDKFALETALVMCANGVETWLFEELRPTPELSFAVRELGADTGVVVTASHNPSEYNGYKVYWNDGSQVVSPHDSGIIEEVRKIGDDISGITEEEAIKTGMLHRLGEDMDERFLDMVERRIVRPQLFRDHASELSMVFTPLHGNGAKIVEKMSGRLSLPITTVPQQREPDGNFPTVELPNPEEGAALKMAIDLAAREQADLVVGADPDSDRIGTAVPKLGKKKGALKAEDYQLITGNQLGVLLADYIFGSMKELGTLPSKPAFIKTIVTTELQRLVAEHYGALVVDTLTGFKHIASIIRKWEHTPGSPQYIFGDEESYGYMIGTEVRDKDAVSATVLTAEMTLYHLSRGKSVIERLEEIYREFGYFQERTISSYFKGQDGARFMKEFMDSLRREPPTEFAGIPAARIHDYKTQKTFDPRTGEQLGSIDLPESNVLQFVLSDETRISVRPSGTEPKIKFYASACGEAGADPTAAKPQVAEKLDRIEREITGMIPESK